MPHSDYVLLQLAIHVVGCGADRSKLGAMFAGIHVRSQSYHVLIKRPRS